MTKFFMSLLLTPLLDKIAVFLIGGQGRLDSLGTDSEEYLV